MKNTFVELHRYKGGNKSKVVSKKTKVTEEMAKLPTCIRGAERLWVHLTQPLYQPIPTQAVSDRKTNQPETEMFY